MSEPIQTCTSVISSIRALPSQANNPIHCEYLRTRGRIVNNLYDKTNKKYTVPKREGCPFETSLNIPKTELGKRVCKDTLTGGQQCSEEDVFHRLPSLVFMVQNNVNCSLTQVSIEDAFCNFTSDKSLCLSGSCESSNCLEAAAPGEPCGYSTYTCRDDDLSGKIDFTPNGILAAVYNIALWQNYQYFTKKNVYEFVIYPYVNTDVCKLDDLASAGCQKLENKACDARAEHPVLGTFPFCIGGKYSCACVNLLIHGDMYRDERSEGCLVSNLHWVGVRLYFKNKDNLVCSKNPASVHIQANKSDPLSGCFTPYFATTRQVILSYARTETSCPEYLTNCAQQFGPPIISECGKYPNYPFPPCPISSNYTSPCGTTERSCEVVDLIWINDCIDFDEFTCFQTCKIFIVLLPTTRCASIIC